MERSVQTNRTANQLNQLTPNTLPAIPTFLNSEARVNLQHNSYSSLPNSYNRGSYTQFQG